MSSSRYSRRTFLQLSTLGLGSLALGACDATPSSPAASSPVIASPVAPTTPPRTIVLDVVHDVPEYIEAYGQIFARFEALHPDITVKQFPYTEEEQASYAAKVAGGYTPAMQSLGAFGQTFAIDRTTYEDFVNLTTIDYPYFDRWTYDLPAQWTQVTGGVPPLYALNPMQGWTVSWMYHQDLMEQAGLDPRRDVQTHDDLKRWLAEGTKWVRSQGAGMQYFWDQGWLDHWFGAQIPEFFAYTFPEGQYEQQLACWSGTAKFNASDSPYRPVLAFFKEAYDQGWLPEAFWTRTWETDMEASYMRKTSVAMLHGPWPWNKAVSADPTVRQQGIPATPPAVGQTAWMQWQSAPELNKASAWAIPATNETHPHWAQIKDLFIWWNSPEIIALRANATGIAPALRYDTPLVLEAPQAQGIVNAISTTGSPYSQVKYEPRLSPSVVVAARRKLNSPGPWDYESGNVVKLWSGLMTNRLSVQDVLDQVQLNWDQSYEPI